MANQHIEINQGTRLGNQLFGAVSTLRPTQNRMKHVRLILEQVASGGDWSAVETIFGVPSGTGESVYNLIVAADTAMSAAALTTVMDRLG